MRPFKLLDIVWGDQEGYVCISTLDRDHNKSWKEHIFQWPDERADIKILIEKMKATHEIYWAPMVFSRDARKEEYSTPCSCLWADLDPVAPTSCFVRPSIAWESSPGRYQAIWLLEDAILPEDHNELNKRLTYAVKADKSGWDLTQVLRLPGTFNHKYVEKPTVKLLWAEQSYHNPQELAHTLPPAETTSLISVDDLDIETAELRSLIFPYRAVLGNLWELLFTPPELIKEGERSDRLWELECRLLAAGVPVTDVVKIVKACPWNKYAGRRDEDKRILTEVLKADKKVRQGPLVVPNDYEVPWVSYSQFLGRQIVGPGWMIDGIWANDSHGMIAGEPKTYKSIIATEIAVSVASGLPMWNRYKVNRTGPVLIVQEENAPWVMQDRLIKIAHGKDLLEGKVYVVNPKSSKFYVEFPKELPIRILNNWGFNLTNDEHRVILTREIERVKPVLIILDPLYLMLGKIDDNSAAELREVLEWLIETKFKYKVSIMILHHWNKGGASARGGQRMLGSTTLHAWVESALYTSIKDTSKNEISIEREFRSFPKPVDLRVKVRMSEIGKDPLYFVNVTEYEENPLVVKPDGDNLQPLLEVLRVHGSCSASELREYTNYSSSSGFKKVLNKLMREDLIMYKGGVKVGKGKTQYYSLSTKGLDKITGGKENE